MEVGKNNTSPLFSIIIANYNNGQYLQECLDSIFAQTYTNWEIILVDDCSTDNSHDLYKGIESDKRIKILFNETNRGVGYTKRKAVDNSSGQYVGIVDPDDKLTPEAIGLVINEFKNSIDIAIVYTNHFICDKDLNIISISNNNGKIPEGKSQLSYNGPKIGHFWAFDKNKYLLTDGINPKLKRAEDQDILYQLEEKGSVIYLDVPAYYYRYHSNSLSTNNSFLKAIFWNLAVSEVAYKRRRKNKEINTPNISRKDLDERWLDYYHSKMIEKAKLSQYSKVLYLFYKSLRYTFSDNKFLTFKILIHTLLGKYDA